MVVLCGHPLTALQAIEVEVATINVVDEDIVKTGLFVVEFVSLASKQEHSTEQTQINHKQRGPI